MPKDQGRSDQVIMLWKTNTVRGFWGNVQMGGAVFKWLGHLIAGSLNQKRKVDANSELAPSMNIAIYNWSEIAQISRSWRNLKFQSRSKYKVQVDIKLVFQRAGLIMKINRKS